MSGTISDRCASTKRCNENLAERRIRAHQTPPYPTVIAKLPVRGMRYFPSALMTNTASHPSKCKETHAHTSIWGMAHGAVAQGVRLHPPSQRPPCVPTLHQLLCPPNWSPSKDGGDLETAMGCPSPCLGHGRSRHAHWVYQNIRRDFGAGRSVRPHSRPPTNALDKQTR